MSHVCVCVCNVLAIKSSDYIRDTLSLSRILS